VDKTILGSNDKKIEIKQEKQITNVVTIWHVGVTIAMET